MTILIGALLLSSFGCYAQSNDLFPLANTLPGPTSSGGPPSLALARVTGTVSYQPANPLITNIAVPNNTNNINIFDYMGNMCPYKPSPGFGIDEPMIPEQCYVKQVHFFQRHGSRYNTIGANTQTFGGRIANASGTLNATGGLAFLNSWKYNLGYEVLTPKGTLELFESGVTAYYQYGYLSQGSNSTTLPVARTTSQDRMLRSAEYFLAGFYGLNWQNHTNLEVVPEPNFNNTDSPNCPNLAAALGPTSPGSLLIAQWTAKYLAAANARLSALSKWLQLDSGRYRQQHNLCVSMKRRL